MFNKLLNINSFNDGFRDSNQSSNINQLNRLQNGTGNPTYDDPDCNKY